MNNENEAQCETPIPGAPTQLRGGIGVENTKAERGGTEWSLALLGVLHLWTDYGKAAGRIFG